MNGIEVKARAKRLRRAVATMFGIPVSIAQSYELLAQEENYPNWDAASKFLGKQVKGKIDSDNRNRSDLIGITDLSDIRRFTKNDVQDAKAIMNMVCDPEGEGLNDHWVMSSWHFLTGLALHLVYEDRAPTLVGMSQCLEDPRWVTGTQMYLNMQSFVHDQEGKAGWTDSDGNLTAIHPGVAGAAREMLMKSDNERRAVLSVARIFLSRYIPSVALQT